MISETESTYLGNIYSDPRIDSMYGVRHLSRRAGYDPQESDQYLHGVYRSWLKKRLH